MPIKISPKLRTAIASANGISKDAVEDILKDKSGGNCYLCDGQFNYASDDIEVDHDVPVDAGGGDALSNLNLSHAECNRFKKAQGSKDVRNLLRFKRFYNEKGGALDYTGALQFFKVTPHESVFEEKKGEAIFHYANGAKFSAPIYEGKHNGSIYKYCFVPAPIDAIFNDDECQPRLIKMNHAFSIATDLAENPLHEPPACRLQLLAGDGRCRVLLFDGQHKALANWLRFEKSIVFKIYLNMSREQATGLINSIQSKIKKLPLTPFELAAKLSDEYSDKLARYEEMVGAEACSEDGSALENHLEQVFKEHGINYTRTGVTESSLKPDFIFPSIRHYHDPAFPSDLLTMLASKSTCKDRWRQILNEAAKIPSKHLLTLEPGISENQTAEMRSEGVALVIPHSIHATYSAAQQAWLLSLKRSDRCGDRAH